MTGTPASSAAARLPVQRAQARPVRRTGADQLGRAFVALTAIGLAATVVGAIRPVIGLYGITMVCLLDAISRVYVFTGGVLRYNTLNYWLLCALVLFATTLVPAPMSPSIR